MKQRNNDLKVLSGETVYGCSIEPAMMMMKMIAIVV